MGTISADTRVKVTLVTMSESSGDYTTMTTAMIMSGKQTGLLSKTAERASNLFSLSLCTNRDVNFSNKLTHFQKKDFAPSLVLKLRVFGTPKRPNLKKIDQQLTSKVK